MPYIAEQLRQVYRDVRDKKGNIIGDEILGTMIARVLATKALALSIESQRPGVLEDMRTMFGDVQNAARYLELEKFIFGPDFNYHDGFIANLAGGRRNFRFDTPEANGALNKTWDILRTNDQKIQGKAGALAKETVGLATAVFKAFTGVGKGR